MMSMHSGARFCVWFFALLLITGLNGQPHIDDKIEQPNIILFLVDDMGWQDTSVPFHTSKTSFNEIYQTPNMERLARQGVVLTNAYAASPVCTPTRTSIMTGQNPGRTHITNWTLRNSREAQETGPKNYPLQSPDWRFEGLQPGDVTLPQVLKEQGYWTIHAGKAHFGAMETAGANPSNLGFDVNIAGHAAGAPGSYYGTHNYSASFRGRDGVWDVPGLEAYHGKGINLTEVLTIEANKAMADAVAMSRPFYLNMAHYGVHTPIMADSQYVDKYSHLDPKEAAYASMLEGMDASLGGLMHQLEAMGEATRTLIVFFSDNGGLSAHARGETAFGTGKNTHNLPLRSGKGSAYEGGTRIPMIVSWARKDDSEPLQQAFKLPVARMDTPVISDDLFPTFMELAGTVVPEGHDVDGTSLVPLLQGGVLEDRVLGWHYPHKWGPEGPGTDPFTAVRKGEWKIIYFYKDARYELYNLAQDLGETTDLAWKQAEKLAEMKAVLKDWMEDVGAQKPKDKKTGVAVELK
ncbi:MAG: sulfatase [Rhodothermales bacterium]